MPEINIELLSIRPTIYAIFMLLSFVISFTFSGIMCKKRQVPPQVIFYSTVYLMVMVFSGGKLYTVYTAKEDVDFIGAPFSSMGGMLGMVLGVFVLCIVYKEHKKAIRDIFCLSIPLLYSISKLGCFFGGCCNGIKYNGPFHVVYRGDFVVAGVDYSENIVRNTMLFPIQLVESIVFFFIFFCCFVIISKKKCKDTTNVVCAMFIVCAITKSGLEFLRMEYAHKLSANQFFCIVVIVVSAIVLLLNRNKKQGK